MAQPLTKTEAPAVDGEQAARLSRLIRLHIGFVWRLLRNLGLSELETRSASLQVFEAATQRIADLRIGSERSFVFGTALRVAASTRKNRAEEGAISDYAPALEDLDEEAQARAMLGALLEQMPLELRVVFTLHLIEQLTITEVAAIIGIPIETCETRLHEAEEDFATHLDPESELAGSLLALAHEEHAPSSLLATVLSTAGVSDVELDEPIPESGAVSARPPALQVTVARSPVRLAATWLVYGWLAGIVIGSAAYALSSSPPRAAVSAPAR